MPQKNYRTFFTERQEEILAKLKDGMKANEIAREYDSSDGVNWKTGKEYIRDIKNGSFKCSEVSIEDIGTDTKTQGYKNRYQPTAIHPDDGHLMDIKEYCEYYKMPFSDLHSYKYVSHSGAPFYNIAFKQKFSDDGFDYIGELKKQLKEIPKHKKTKFNKQPRTGVITITDLHFGSYVEAMINTPKFSVAILVDMLERSATHLNQFNYDKVHIHILGDIIETFTGLNHKNSWKGIERGMFGVEAVILFTKLFKEHFLDNVNNLDTIKVVAGNHDRVTSSKDEDVDGGAARLFVWGLELLNYKVEFSPTVLKHVVGDICYILNHGHLGLTRMSAKEMAYDFGEQGLFNFIMEGHLHSRIQRMNATQIKNFKIVDDDSKDCRRQVCPSLFTGNVYSEQNGWSATPGFLITESDGNGKPIVHDYPL